MTRGTPRPAEEVWYRGLRWVDAAHMQAYRFWEALFEQDRAEMDATMRDRLNVAPDTEHLASWRASYDQHPPYHPERPIRVPTHRLHMQVSTELDFLMVALRNVLHAQDRLPEEVRTQMGQQDVLRLLRNVTEHWNEADGDSARVLARDHPDIDPWTYAYTGKEVWLGGSKGVPLSRVIAWIARVDRALRECLTGVGITPPEGRASRFPLDDDRAWPPERLRFHWSLPVVPEQEWPREEMPDELSDLLAERFANLRRRDWTD